MLDLLLTDILVLKSFQFALLLTLSTSVAAALLRRRNLLSKYPLINGRRRWEFSDTNAKKRFAANAKDLIIEGFSKSSEGFRLLTDSGWVIVLPAKHADAIKDNKDLSFGKMLQKDFHADLPGFQPFKQGTTNDKIFHDAIKLNLTQGLDRLTEPVSDETAHALQKNWTDDEEWHEVNTNATVLQIAAQISSRVFLGGQLCRNPDWLRITINYTVDAITGALALRLWPSFIRPAVHWVLPYCRKIRTHLAEGRAIIDPVLEKRREEKQTTVAMGKNAEKHIDAMEWLEEAAKGRKYDPVTAQVMLSLAAIHTLSDALTQVLHDLCQHPEVTRSLREEIHSVVSEHGWQKSTLYNLKLMDSVLKESQRLKPAALVTLRREALRATYLPDGTPIPRGTTVMISGHQMWDSSVYPNAHEFDGYRFLKMRSEAGKEFAAQFVSTTPEHLGFGYGKAACPGRFFAAKELKIALCHILTKYDIKPASGSKPQAFTHSFFFPADPVAKIAIRRRRSEVEL